MKMYSIDIVHTNLYKSRSANSYRIQILLKTADRYTNTLSLSKLMITVQNKITEMAISDSATRLDKILVTQWRRKPTYLT